MSCVKPNYLIDYGIDENTHKHVTRFVFNNGSYEYRNLSMLKYYNNDGVTQVYAIPCGKCPSCIKKYRLNWSLRCEAEAKCHARNSFVTLTYDEKHNDGLLHREHLKEFIKKLRNRDIKVRYFGCGEYSPDNRPHYHLILFGFFPDDISLISKSKTGFYLYKSLYIENLWNRGLCTVQEFDSAVAGYVAGYVDKKLNDDSGFLMMSNKPGIGHDYFIKNLEKLFESDKFVSKNGFIASLPRYFDKVADSCFFDIEPLKLKRRKFSEQLTVGSMIEHKLDLYEHLYSYVGNIENRRKKYARGL